MAPASAAASHSASGLLTRRRRAPAPTRTGQCGRNGRCFCRWMPQTPPSRCPKNRPRAEFPNPAQVIAPDASVLAARQLAWAGQRTGFWRSERETWLALCDAGLYGQFIALLNDPFINLFCENSHSQLPLYPVKLSCLAACAATCSPLRRGCLDFNKSRPPLFVQTQTVFSRSGAACPHFTILLFLYVLYILSASSTPRPSR